MTTTPTHTTPTTPAETAAYALLDEILNGDVVPVLDDAEVHLSFALCELSASPLPASAPVVPSDRLEAIATVLALLDTAEQTAPDLAGQRRARRCRDHVTAAQLSLNAATPR